MRVHTLCEILDNFCNNPNAEDPHAYFDGKRKAPYRFVFGSNRANEPTFRCLKKTWDDVICKVNSLKVIEVSVDGVLFHKEYIDCQPQMLHLFNIKRK